MRSRHYTPEELRRRTERVSIAFRRSVRSRLLGAQYIRLLEKRSPLPFGVQCVPDPMLTRRMMSTRSQCLHCLSAFTAFPTGARRRTSSPQRRCLHCLSAFSAFPTAIYGQTGVGRHLKSPLPFGVQCVPDTTPRRNSGAAPSGSPLPFGVQCVPDIMPILQNSTTQRLVSIAFRRSVRSRPVRMDEQLTTTTTVSIAFRRSVRSRRSVIRDYPENLS